MKGKGTKVVTASALTVWTALLSHLIIAYALTTAHVLGAVPLAKTARKGPVTATVSLEPSEPRIGDTVTLTLRVVAEGNVELLMPEFGEALEQFPIVDFALEELIDEEQRIVVTQTYQLQPPRSGPQYISPIMIEFVDRRQGQRPSPDGFDAYELLTEQLAFEVESVVPDDAEADLHPPLGKLTRHASSTRARWPWVILAVAILIAAPLVGLFWSRSRRRARRRSAYEIAMVRLDRLLAQPRDNPKHVDSFFVELSSLVRWYLETRFDLRAPERTTEEFLNLASESPDLSREHQLQLREFLHRADLVKFAQFSPSVHDIDDSVSSARRFLDETCLDSSLVEHAQDAAA